MTVPNSPTGIIDLFLHPPITLMRPVLDEFGPYSSGSHELANFGWDNGVITPRLVSQTWGVTAQLAGAIPAGWGFTQGWVSNDGQSDESVYDPPLAQLVAQHQFPNGAWFTTTYLLVDRFPVTAFWQTAFPGRVGLLVAPHISIDLFYMIER